MWQSKREISRECNDIIGSAKGLQISEKYWGEVGKGKRADVYLEVRKGRGHIFFEWNKCLWWFLYVLSKFQGMFKILQWFARLRKTPTLKIARSSPQKFSIYRSCIKSSIEVLKYNQIIKYGQFSQYYKVKETFFKRDYFRIYSKLWLGNSWFYTFWQ